MKLKKKLIVITCFAATVFGIVSGIINMMIMKNSMISEANAQASIRAREIFNVFEKRIDSGISEYSMNYLLKTDNNWRNVVYINKQGSSERTAVYNQTIFDYDQLSKAAVRISSYSYDKISIDRPKLEYDGGLYFVSYEIIGDYELFRLYEVTDVFERFEKHVQMYVFIGLGLLSVIILVLIIIMRKVLLPLKSLSEAATDMAGGDYSKRVEVKTKDEIGILAEHFNVMAEAVETENKKILESERKKTLMMGNLSHELKTPMTAIAGYAETLLSSKLTEEQQNEALYYIYTETNRLGRLSKKMMRLLDLSEGEAVEKKKIYIDELFESIKETMSVRLKEKNIDLITETDVDAITSDEDLIKDVIINLLDNSIKASDTGSRIYLTFKDKVLSVKDEGIGIPKKDLDSVTEAFYRVDKSRSRKEGGAGLGLSIIKLILDKLGAKMEMESSPGEGTEVRITGIN
ncbi:Signal transduction histidine kinase [Eubacterium ruminantium]|uniref:histidine kinase n=1 Tax=Eubacterium ruminantium TaxID=42322 RepID=A0A1T4L9R7_9FIRM|nr:MULTISPECIES: HAMP domain-containing sensor histidine kinase [Eubacterium]MCR5368243.1 HAMP domain-containing histidine kinase [Eubacterium sp.]SCW44370.1 Signal transduction histidine kinase [Eubacterium ruminantium]SDM76957.1 Signal transduction histidine kinase [Eubacterium ruminantium]SJZ51318.1 Signal transduction histidine kinase [Eubacterium ruminantium]